MTSAAAGRRGWMTVRRPQILASDGGGDRANGGCGSVRLADVAKRAGMSATSVVYYFGTKDQLFALASSPKPTSVLRAAARRAGGAGQRGGADRPAGSCARAPATGRCGWTCGSTRATTRRTAVAQRHFHGAVARGRSPMWCGRVRPRGSGGCPTRRGRVAAVGADRRAGRAHGARRPRAHARGLRGGCRWRRPSLELGCERPSSSGPPAATPARPRAPPPRLPLPRLHTPLSSPPRPPPPHLLLPPAPSPTPSPFLYASPHHPPLPSPLVLSPSPPVPPCSATSSSLPLPPAAICAPTGSMSSSSPVVTRNKPGSPNSTGRTSSPPRASDSRRAGRRRRAQQDEVGVDSSARMSLGASAGGEPLAGATDLLAAAGSRSVRRRLATPAAARPVDVNGSCTASR